MAMSMATISAKLRPNSLPLFSTSAPKFPSQFLTRLCNFSKPTNITLTTGRSGGDHTSKSRFVTRASASNFSPDICETLGDVTIYTASGEPVMFKDLWDQKEGIAIVALLRHFGCICCWELASTLKEYKERIEGAGVKLIAVGVGTPDKARMLAERLPFPMDCLYADPDRKAYDLLGLYYGLGRTFFNPASAKVFSRSEAIKKAMKNYTIKATPDDASGVLQQGGMFVFKGKELLYARKDEGTGDHAPLDDVIEVCCKVPVA